MNKAKVLGLVALGVALGAGGVYIWDRIRDRDEDYDLDGDDGNRDRIAQAVAFAEGLFNQNIRPEKEDPDVPA